MHTHMYKCVVVLGYAHELACTYIRHCVRRVSYMLSISLYVFMCLQSAKRFVPVIHLVLSSDWIHIIAY